MDGGWPSDHGRLERVLRVSYRRRLSLTGGFLVVSYERPPRVSYRRRLSLTGGFLVVSYERPPRVSYRRRLSLATKVPARSDAHPAG